MPLPTEAAIQSSIGLSIKAANALLVAPGAAYDTAENAFLVALPSDPSPQAAVQMANVRAAYNSAYDQLAGVLVPQFTTYFKVMGFQTRDFIDGWRQLYEYFALNAKFVKSSVYTFGTPASVSSTGTGTVHHLKKDGYGLDVETARCYPGAGEVTTVRCVADQWLSGGQLGSERFLLRGAPRSKDNLVRTGSGIAVDVTAIGGASPTGQFLQNQSFDTYEGTDAANPTGLNGWTANVAVSSATFTFDEVNYFRTYSGVIAARALNIKSTCIVSQTLRTRWTAGSPAYCRLAYNRAVGGATGTLVLRLGAASVSVVLAAQAGWNVLRIDFDDDAWFRKFDQATVDVQIDWTRTGGALLIDDVILGPWTPVGDGSFVVVDPGATAWKFDDNWSWTDSAVDAGVNQYWFRRALGLSLPASTGGAITWADS